MDLPAPDRKKGGEPAEARTLLRAYCERGDTGARERLIELYMPLVESVVRRYDRSGREHDDLLQVGSIGLINAIDRFDIARGGDLGAYAAPTIEGEIKRYLRDHGGSVRLPRRLHEEADPVTRRRAREPLPLNHETGGPASEPSDRALAASEERLLLAGAFRSLTEDERSLLYRRLVQEESAASVAGDLGISERQLSRRTRAALDKLRGELERDPETHPERLPLRTPGRSIASVGATRAAVPDPYLARPYSISIARTGEGEAAWTAKVEELPGCQATGATPGEAAQSLEPAMEQWIAEALSEDREVPEPRATKEHSGRLLLRMPQSLHSELARAAEREEISLNQFITSSLASVVEWRRGGAPPRVAGGSRWLRVALLTNMAVLVLAAVAAVVLLVIALNGG